MIRNLKALGLAFAVAFILSAVAASAASAEPALFTAEVGARELAHIDGGQVGGNVFAVGGVTLTCDRAETPFSADLTIQCPPEGPEQIELHVYNDNAHEHNEEVLCTYDVGHQVINNAIQLTNVEGSNGSELIVKINATIAMSNTNPSFICSTASASSYEGENTLQATNEEGNYVNSLIS